MAMSTRKRRGVLLHLLLSVAGVAQVCQGAEDHEHGACTSGRLIYWDATNSKIKVLDLDDGEIEGEIQGVGASAPREIIPTSDHKSVAVNFDTDNEFMFVNPGLMLESHGDHYDVSKSNPSKYSLEGKCAACRLPVHFIAGANRMAIFFDGTAKPQEESNVNSRAMAIDDRTLQLSSTKSLDAGLLFDSGPMQPQHGIIVPLTENEYLVSQPNTEFATSVCPAVNKSVCDKLANGFKGLRKGPSSNVEMSWTGPADCKGYHGYGFSGGWHAFGCGNGGSGTNLDASFFLAVKMSDGAIQSKKVPYHEDAKGSINAFYGHPSQSVLVGTYKNGDGTFFIRWKVGEDKYDNTNDVLKLDTALSIVSLGFDLVSGKHFVIFDTSGVVRLYDLKDKWTLVTSMKLVDSFQSTSAYKLVLGYHRMYLFKPEQSEIVEIHLFQNSTLSSGRSFKVDGKPDKGVVLGMTPREAVEIACADGYSTSASDASDARSVSMTTLLLSAIFGLLFC